MRGPQRPCTSHSRISLKATEKRSAPEGEKWHVCTESLCWQKSWNTPLVDLISFSTRSNKRSGMQRKIFQNTKRMWDFTERWVKTAFLFTFWSHGNKLTLGWKAHAWDPMGQADLFYDLRPNQTNDEISWQHLVLTGSGDQKRIGWKTKIDWTSLPVFLTGCKTTALSLLRIQCRPPDCDLQGRRQQCSVAGNHPATPKHLKVKAERYLQFFFVFIYLSQICKILLTKAH